MNMKFEKEHEKKEKPDEYFEIFKGESDQKAVKGFLLSVLLKALTKTTEQKSKRIIRDNIDQLTKKGDIITKQKDKYAIINLIEEEIRNAKSRTNEFVILIAELRKLVQPFESFANNYPKNYIFNEEESFLWFSKEKNNNVSKLECLNRELASYNPVGITKVAGMMEKLLSMDGANAGFLRTFVETKKIMAELIGTNESRADEISIRNVFERISRKDRDEASHKFISGKTIAIELNMKAKGLVEVITELCIERDKLISKIKTLIDLNQKETQSLMDDIKRVQKSQSLKSLQKEKTDASPDLKVLLLTHEFEKGGGVATVTKKLSENFNKKGTLAMDVLTRPPPAADLRKPVNYAFFYRGKNKTEFTTASEMALFMSDIQYKILHLHSLSFTHTLRGGLDKIKNTNPNSKLVYTCHSIVAHERLQQDKYKPWGSLDIEAQDEIMAQADKITHLTNFGAIIAHGTWKEFEIVSKRKQNSYYPQYRDKAVIIPNGIDLNYSFFESARQIMPFATRIKNIAYIGRLSEEKGVINLAKAFSRLTKEHSELALRLIIIGEEYPGTGVKSQMQYYLSDVSSNCEFRGWKKPEEMDSEYKTIDLVIIPSFNESFSIVALEAFAHNKPVIISNVDGPQELFVKSNLALGIDPTNVDSIIDAIISCVNNPNEMMKKVKLAREEIIKKYNWHHVSEQYEKLYRAILNNAPFESDFKPPAEKVTLLEPEHPVLNQHRIGLFYDQEFWSPFIHLLEEKGYVVDTYGTGIDRDVKARDLKKFVQDNDIILSCSASATNWQIVSSLCSKYKKPHILRYGGGFGFRQDNLQKEEFRSALRSATVLAPTDLLSSRVLEKIEVPVERQLIIPNPVDLHELNKIDKDKSVLRARFNLPEDKCIIGFIGRIDPLRNAYYLAEAYCQYCNYLKKNNLPNNLTFLIQGKIMTNYTLPEDYFPGVSGKFEEKLKEKIRQIVNEFGGTINQINSGAPEMKNKGLFGENNIIYKPLTDNIKPNIYQSLIASCDIISILPGFGVGSNTATAEALALGKRVISIGALTNPYAFGPAGIFARPQKRMVWIDNMPCFIPELNDLLDIFKQINATPQKYSQEFNDGKEYIDKTMAAQFLVNERLIPAITSILGTYDPETNTFNTSMVKKMYFEAFNIMRSEWNPENGLWPY
jgi:glycosyltransferase involved in cell wall biosynthesis